MSFTLCTSQAIVNAAGANVSSSASVSEGILIPLSDEAEGRLNAETRYDWVANLSKIGTNFKSVLADATANYAGAKLVDYDKSGYTNRGYAEDTINVNMDRFQKIVTFLKDDKVKTAMGAIDT